MPRSRAAAAEETDVIVLVCTTCGTEHPLDLQRKWGQAGFGDGYGPEVRCIALRTDERSGGGFVCRGQLVAVQKTVNVDDIEPEG